MCTLILNPCLFVFLSTNFISIAYKAKFLMNYKMYSQNIYPDTFHLS